MSVKRPKKPIFEGLSSDITLIRYLSKLYVAQLGFYIFLFLILIKGPYKGRQIFYRRAQTSDNHFGRIIRSFLTLRPLLQVFTDYQRYLNEYENPKLSKIAIQQYSDLSLSGYGDKKFKKGGKNLLDQQRSLIIKPLFKYLNNLSKKITIAEIGTGNGDIISYVENAFPKNKYIGCDFILKNAKESYPNNIEWIEGYALNLIPQIKPDLVFSSSTWVIFTPSELDNYLKSLNDNGCKDIFISEPFWSTKYQFNEDNVESFHLEEAIWLHNWPAYFKKNNYAKKTYEVFPYKHPLSTRPDIRIVLGHWQLLY